MRTNPVLSDAPVHVRVPLLWGVGCWLLMWMGLSARLDPVITGGWVEKLHALRAWLPLMAGATAMFLWAGGRGRAWSASEPLAGLAAYGAVGLLSSLIYSPKPLLALYWVGCYVAAVAVMLFWSAEVSGARLRILADLNWLIAAVLGLSFAVFVLDEMLQHGRPSMHGLLTFVDVPVVFGISMIRETGIGRLLGIVTVIAMARSVSGFWLQRARWALIVASIFWMLIAVIAFLLVLPTNSESALLSTTAGTGLVCWLAAPRWARRASAWAVVAGLIGLELVLPGRLLSPSHWVDHLSGRVHIWRTSFALIADSPLLGLGFHADRFLLQAPYKNHVSNAFIHAFVQAGVIGGVCFAAAWVAAWRAAWRSWRLADAAARRVVLEAAGALAFLTVRAFFESTGAFFGVDLLLLVPVFVILQQAGRAADPMPAALDPAATGRLLPELQVLGSRFHPVGMEDALQCIDQWVEERVPGRYVIVTGMHGVLEGYRHPSFRAILNAADLFVPDGFSLVWVARRKGVALPKRVCGTDLLWQCCQRGAARGLRVFFYGDTDEVLQRLCARLRRELPGLQIAGAYSPPFRPLTAAEDTAIIQRINETKPDILWVGLGLPKQERWIVEHRSQLDVPVLVAVGAAFKFVSGAVQRAPEALGERGLEWFWRFLHEPRRLWRRALLDVPYFTGLVLLELAGVLRVPAASSVSAVRNDSAHPLIPPLASDRLEARTTRGAKRALDVGLSATGLLLSSPLWALIACLVKVQDGGPVFYAQERVGLHGRRFRSLNFRTMVQDSDATYGILQAGEDDPRITPIGRILRATAMDELPQLWSILKGDMSFVGPRALAPGEIDVGSRGAFLRLDEIPGYEVRQRVRPGLTGVAQIFAPRDVPRRQKFRYDRLYIARASSWLDLNLLALSFWITLRGTWESRAKKF